MPRLRPYLWHRHDRVNADHYTKLSWLGGAGCSGFNSLLNAHRGDRLMYVSPDGTASRTYRPYPATLHIMLPDNAYDWRTPALVALQRLLYTLLLGRTVTLYLPGHQFSPYRKRRRIVFTSNANV